MSIVMHPLTALDGSPVYTADDYRHAVNPFIFPSNATSFHCIQGVRAGVVSPMCSLEGLTVSVLPHCGVIAPWTGVGVYTYAVTEPISVDIPDLTGRYKIAITLEDPSQGHGDVPRGLLQAFSISVADKDIPGLVLAHVNAGVIGDVATRINQSSLLYVKDAAWVSDIAAMNGQEAIAESDGGRYKVINGSWHRVDDIQLIPGQWLKDWPGTTYKCALSGNVATLSIKAVRGPEWKAKAWDKSQIFTFPDFLKPKLIDINIAAVGADHSAFQLDPSGLYVRPTADVTYGTGSWISAAFSWPV
jgi:hypothetical protein|nr:MAG TPA: hypothetical protein [Caudoviricetes sp.]